jgi:hypothetical protein
MHSENTGNRSLSPTGTWEKEKIGRKKMSSGYNFTISRRILCITAGKIHFFGEVQMFEGKILHDMPTKRPWQAENLLKQKNPAL